MVDIVKKNRLFFLTSFLIFLSIGKAYSQSVTVANLRCEYRVNPLGVDADQPMLSWEIQSDQKNSRQSAYRIIVSDNQELLQKNIGNIWDSKKIRSSATVQVDYKGKTLESVKRYFWKVMVWDNKNRVSNFSEVAFWQMGLLNVSDWNNAKWIGYDVLPDSNIYLPFMHGNGQKAWGTRADILPLFRKVFSIKKRVKTATAFVSGLGHFEMSVNGTKISNHILDPGWTQYTKHAQYVTLDIASALQSGDNAIGLMLGNGFYFIPGERYRKMTGAYGYPKAIANIVVEYSDGSKEFIVSDTSWKAASGPIYFSSIFGGEDYDANKEQLGWNTTIFDARLWAQAMETTGPLLLQSQMQQPIEIKEQFEPIKKSKLADNSWVFDLGQNFSGIPAIQLMGKKGDTVKIMPTELINEDGSANQNASGSQHIYSYILKGEGTEKWQPRFTYYGFRYIQVKGAVPENIENIDKLPVIKNIKGLHIRNAASAVGFFNCSNELFNKTNNLILWAIKSNMASVFTDCPHREKLGWLEQTHLMGSSVQYNYDVAALNRKVINDMMQAQYADGKIPEISPEFTEFIAPFDESPEWGSASVILPWYNYLWYGDKRTLSESYNMMARYVGYLQNQSKHHILSHGLGDWFDIGPDRPGVAQLTPLGVTATAIYYYDITILEKTAIVLGKTNDAKKYHELATLVKYAFNKEFFNITTKQYATGSQTANAMAIYTGLVPAKHKDDVLNNLITDIQKRGNALTAGDIGYRYVLRVLEDAGRSDVIYAMNSRTDVPGYGYQLAHGATALTESWQAYPNVSNNHFMLGHLMEWFYSGLCGIRQAEGSVGFKQLEIRPQPVGDIQQSKANYNSVNGFISVEWKIIDKAFHLFVTIPANSKATVYFPASFKRNPVKIGSGSYQYVVKQ